MNSYEQRLERRLIEQCRTRGMLSGELLEVQELWTSWQSDAPAYLADSMPQFDDYPTAAIAWAAYFGMGAAALWDENWGRYSSAESLYELIRTPRGFDAMDEYVTEELLKMDGIESVALSDFLCSAAHTALAMMRAEGVENGSKEAFHLYASTVAVFFRVGVAISLQRAGYAYHKVKVDLTPSSVVSD